MDLLVQATLARAGHPSGAQGWALAVRTTGRVRQRERAKVGKRNPVLDSLSVLLGLPAGGKKQRGASARHPHAVTQLV